MSNGSETLVSELDAIAASITAATAGIQGPARTVATSIAVPALRIASLWLQSPPASAEAYARLWGATERLIAATDALIEAAAKSEAK